jgi:signal transduction histidine kinase
MAQGSQSHREAGGSTRAYAPGARDRRPVTLPGIDHQILLLRWLALLIVIVLHWFDRSVAGVILPVPEMTLVIVGYNIILLLLMRYVRWLRRPLNYLALDTVVVTLAVCLTGGYHSSFFVLYIYITIGAAFQLDLVPTVIVALVTGLIYVVACYVSPASLQSTDALYIMAAKLLGLLVVAVTCALLLEQLRREQRESERERELSRRLIALSDLFQQLNAALDLKLILQQVAEAPRTLLDADLASIALLDEESGHLSVVAAAGPDSSPAGQLSEEGAGQSWPADDARLAAILSAGQPYVVEAGHNLDALPAILTGRPPGADLDQLSNTAASAVAIPLLQDGAPLGLLTVAYRQARTFTEEDLTFLSALGQEAALAIRNAHLFEREREQVARLRELEQLQAGFVSAVSHELRTPLTVIKSSVELLRATLPAAAEHRPRGTRAQATGAGGALQAEPQAELIRAIEDHTSHLEALVADLLEVTRLEAGQATLASQPTDLRSLISHVVDDLRPLSGRKRQAVRLHLPDTASHHPGGGTPQVEVDRRRIEQVLTNILGNAIKFTPKQGQIDVSLTETPDGVQVCIADNGPGIAEKDQARVFDKFYVVPNGRGLAGLGLGLYLVRQNIELHNGQVWVTSQEGQGATFCFSLPKEQTP